MSPRARALIAATRPRDFSGFLSSASINLAFARSFLLRRGGDKISCPRGAADGREGREERERERERGGGLSPAMKIFGIGVACRREFRGRDRSVERWKKNTLCRGRRFKAVGNILHSSESGHWRMPAGFNRPGGPTAALRTTRAYLHVSECCYKWKHS